MSLCPRSRNLSLEALERLGSTPAARLFAATARTSRFGALRPMFTGRLPESGFRRKPYFSYHGEIEEFGWDDAIEIIKIPSANNSNRGRSPISSGIVPVTISARLH